MTTTNACFSRTPGVRSAQYAGETMLIAPADHRRFRLNSTGTHVWRLLPAAGATGATTDDLVDALVEIYDVERSTCHAEVTRLLTAMTDAGVVTSTP